MNNIIWKGVSSTTIKGLIISELPPISKPEMRVMETVIDGRNGSLIEDLGYNSYDKLLTIGLYGDYNIDEVIKYFTGEGDVVFSNEPDKVYRAKINAQIDYTRLLRYRQATVLFRTQPFKYAFNEEVSTTTASASGTSIVVNDSENANFKEFKIYGKSTQDGTPTPDAPIDIVSIGDDGNITVNVNGGDVEHQVTFTTPLRAIPVTDESLATYTDAEGKMWCADEIDLEKGVYIQRVANVVFDGSEEWVATTTETTGKYRFVCVLDNKATNFDATVIPPMMCNQEKIVGVTTTFALVKGITTASDGGTLYFYNETYNTGDITLLKQHLAESPMMVLYLLETPIETPLTEEQIAVGKSLKSNNPTTTIFNDENAYMSVEYLRPFEVENKGLETSRPIMTITGTGTVEISVNGMAVFTYTFPEGENQVVIDSEKEDAYLGSVLKNRNMNGEFPVLQPGTNKIEWTGDVERIEIEPKSRWL